MKKQVLPLLVVLLGLTFGLSAAGQTDAASSKELRFIDVSPSPTRQEYFTTTFAKFKEETGIDVVYESVPWDDAANKLTVLGASGQLPDVMTTWSGWLGQYTEAGWIEPLAPYIGDSSDEYAATVTNLVWKSEKQLYGNIYTVPDGMMVNGLTANISIRFMPLQIQQKTGMERPSVDLAELLIPCLFILKALTADRLMQKTDQLFWPMTKR